MILELRDGAVVAVEAKASTSSAAGHLHHVRWLRDKLNSAAPGTLPGRGPTPYRLPSLDRGRPAPEPPHQHFVVRPSLIRTTEQGARVAAVGEMGGVGAWWCVSSSNRS